MSEPGKVELEKKAWEIYCDQTKHSTNAKDFFWELGAENQRKYLDEAALWFKQQAGEVLHSHHPIIDDLMKSLGITDKDVFSFNLHCEAGKEAVLTVTRWARSTDITAGALEKIRDHYKLVRKDRP